MKNWNKPEIEEIKVTLTMGGTDPSNTERAGGMVTKFIYAS